MSDQINTGIGRKRKKSSQSLSYKEQLGGGGGGGGGTITSSWKDWAEYSVTVHPM